MWKVIISLMECTCESAPPVTKCAVLHEMTVCKLLKEELIISKPISGTTTYIQCVAPVMCLIYISAVCTSKLKKPGNNLLLHHVHVLLILAGHQFPPENIIT